MPAPPDLDDAAATDVVRWAVDRFGSSLCLTTSMTDTVLIHLATRVDPDIEVVFLDTGFHFAETLGTLRRAMARYALRVTTVRPEDSGEAPVDVWSAGQEACCEFRKTRPLDAFLATKSAWLSGIRRADSPERSSTPVVEVDRRGLVKINPLARWSDDDVARYVADHQLVVNPLLSAGYPSIGCWPCTEPAIGDDARSGRWAGSTKTECGIHR